MQDWGLAPVLLHRIYWDAPASALGTTLRVDTRRRSAASCCQTPRGVWFTLGGQVINPLLLERLSGNSECCVLVLRPQRSHGSWARMVFRQRRGGVTGGNQALMLIKAHN